LSRVAREHYCDVAFAMMDDQSAQLAKQLANLRLDVPAWERQERENKQKKKKKKKKIKNDERGRGGGNRRGGGNSGCEGGRGVRAGGGLPAPGTAGQVCRVYVPGRADSCRFGSRCRYVHETPTGSTSTDHIHSNRRNHGQTRISHHKVKSARSMTLTANISPFIVGTCLDMCPEAERARRHLEGSVAVVERDHASLPGKTLQQLMVKQYSRSAAGDEVLHARDVRPPPVLLKTARYLCTYVLDLDQNGQPDPRWRDDRKRSTSMPALVGNLEVFISDRFRMIEKDLAVQGFSASGFKVDHDAIRCFEMAVRYHLLMSYACREAAVTEFDPVLNWKMMGNYASSLHNLYMHARRFCDPATARVWCGNEDRLRSYIFLSRLPAPGTRGTEVQTSIETGMAMSIQTMLTRLAALCPDVLQGPRVRAAIRAIEAYYSNDYAAFFSIVRQEKDSDPLFLCAMHAQFTRMRVRALNAVNRAYRGNFRTSTLVPLLGCNSGGEAMNICTAMGLATRDKKGDDGSTTPSADSSAAATMARCVVLNHREKVYLRKEHYDLLKGIPLPAVDEKIREHRRAPLVVGRIWHRECGNCDSV
jgi:hypothetical protein